MEGGIPVFDGEGYEIWRKKMKTLFRSLELWHLVEQGYEKENDSEKMRELKKKDAKALYLIQQGVCNSIFQVIINCKSSKSAWDTIRNKFDRIQFQKQQIEIAIPEIKRGNETEILTNDQVSLDVTQKKCIFRVPDELRNGNEEFYEPKWVAIGPYHRGKPRLASMEADKNIYKKELLKQTGNHQSVESLVEAVKQHEQRVRICYDKPITNLNSDELAQMMVLDGCYIIELFVKHGEKKVSDQINYPDKIELIALQNDMLLIENQIPFFILQILFNKIFPTPPDNLIFITLRFFRKKLKRYGLSNYADWMYSDLIDNQDLLYHLLHIIHKFLTSPFSPDTSKQKSQINRFINPATKLEEAYNVNLKTKTKSSSMFDITFQKGVLEIPRWSINNQTEIEFRNLIAFEVCQQLHEERFFIDYVLFMNHLVTSSDDVNLLMRREIFINHMPSAKAVDTMLRNLTKKVEASTSTYNYYKITEHLNIYCNRHRNEWMVSLKKKYFKNPWTIISLVAGFVILCLTAIQTVFTIK